MFSAFEQENIKQRELKETERVLDNVANVLINGTELILSRVLWVIERAYRITKGTLEMRPMFHFTQKRIEAHVCICFVAYKVYKELERILLENNINLSVDKVLSIAKTVTTIRVKLPHNNSVFTKLMLLSAKHNQIAAMFADQFWKKPINII